MTAVRRIYLYVVAFAGLAAVSLGAANLVRTLVEAWGGTPAATTPGYFQDQVALWSGTALVGLPVWALHWWWAVLGDVATYAGDIVAADWWRERISLFATLTMVGLPARLLH